MLRPIGQEWNVPKQLGVSVQSSRVGKSSWEGEGLQVPPPEQVFD